MQDQKGFIWFGTLDGLNRFDGYNFKVFRTDPKNPHSIGNNFISSLYFDKRNTLWAGTHNGLWRYDQVNENFHLLQFTYTYWIGDIIDDTRGNLWFICNEQPVCYNIKSQKHKTFNQPKSASLGLDAKGNIWVGTSLGYILQYNNNTGAFKRHNVLHNGKPVAALKVNKLFDTGADQLLIGTQDHGLKILNTRSLVYTDIPLSTATGAAITVTDIVKTDKNTYWISTTSGLYIFNRQTNSAILVANNETDPNSLSDNNIKDLNVDKEGGIWISCKYEGVNYYHSSNAIFSRYLPKNTIGARDVVGQIVPDDANNLWIATENNGLYQFNRRSGVLQRRFSNYTKLSGLFSEGNRLWLGKDSEGLDILNTQTNQLIKRSPEIFKDGKTGEKFVSCILKTRRGIFIGTTTGLYLVNNYNDDLVEIKGIPNIVLSSLFEDHNGNVWAGSFFSGLYYIRPGSVTGKSFSFNFSMGGRFNNAVTTISEDIYGTMWFGTEGAGVTTYNPHNKKITTLTTANGLPSNNAFKLLNGTDNKMWLSTAAGICQIDPQTKYVKVFNTSNGLPCEQFNYNSGYAAPDGTLYFGSIKGLIAFNTNQVNNQAWFPPLYITGLQVEGNELPVGAEKLSLDESITNTKSLTLPYDNATISLDFAALSFQSPVLTHYRYMMEGLENKWTYLKTNRKAYFTKLPPGNYIFKVQAATNNGQWGATKTLNITITPPWWLSTWAYIGYVLLTITAIVLVVRYYYLRMKEKNRRLYTLLRLKKDREVYEAKIDFFTNIAHEIRTPLTLIVAPIEKVEQSNNLAEIKNNNSVIKRNAERLVSLTNQLLDFRKIEQKDLKLNFTKTDVYALVNEIFTAFTLAADAKAISYRLRLYGEKKHAFTDQEAVRKMLSNLIQNAIKYGQHEVDVFLDTQEEEQFTVSVVNDGAPIAANLREKIFEPFYRLKSAENIEGTGIGLALARSLAELHNGSLTLAIDDTKNKFILSLPLRQEIEFNFEALSADKINNAGDDDRQFNEKPAILLVEDNADILNFLYHEFNDSYQLFTAGNGDKAIELLNENEVQLVVSDVMMPGKSGFELCSYIKQNVDLSHIPVILLTAKNNINSKIQGLELGADAYIEKPFSPAHLKAQVSSLLLNREKIIHRFNTSPVADIQSIAVSKTDDIFLNKLNETIVGNISNTALDADELASIMYVSKRNLYRKIKAVSGISPVEMINIIRLKKAAELLTTTDMKVYEIAAHTGFKSPDTFSRNFAKQFGQLPTDYARQNAPK